MPRSRRKTVTCYMCSEKATSREHVPPISFFPEKRELKNDVNYRVNLLTVPSCDLHNSAKSDDDQYLLFVVVGEFRANEIAQKIFSKKVIKAIKRRPVLLSFFKGAFGVRVGGRQTIGYHVDRERFDRTISRMAMALYFHTYKEKWLGQFFVYSPDIFSTNSLEVNKTISDLEKSTSEMLMSQEFQGDNPEIFRYKVYRKDNGFVARMLF